MNAAIAYIEAHLTEEIDYARLARIACCPTHQFQRIFAFMADMTPWEYVRRRRLTLAGHALQGGDARIIDVALAWGYDSHAAFTRAFKEHHGASPALARKGHAPLKSFERLSFPTPLRAEPGQNYRVEKGKMKMARLVKIELMPFGPYRVIGKRIRTRPMSQAIAALWGRCFADGTYEGLLRMKDHIPADIGDDYIGLILGHDELDGSIDYMVGMFMNADAAPPQGYDSYDIPACTIAKAWIQGEEYDIYAGAQALTETAISENGYEVDRKNAFRCEVYTDARFGTPKSKGERVLILDYLVPCGARL